MPAPTHQLFIFITIGVPFVAYYLGKDFKKKTDEELTYRNFYSHGFFMFFFASLILAAVEYVYYGFINTEFITEQYNTLLQNIEILIKTFIYYLFYIINTGNYTNYFFINRTPLTIHIKESIKISRYSIARRFVRTRPQQHRRGKGKE